MTSASLAALFIAGFFISPLQTEVEFERPDTEFLLLKAHEAYYEKGRNQEALNYYFEAVEADPKSTDALNARGWFYLNLGITFSQEALADFDTILTLDPEDPRAYHGRGWALANLGDYTEAIHSFATYSRMRPESPAGSDGMGWALAGLGEYKAARNAYRRAYLLDPDFGYFLETQAWCSLLMGQEQEAIHFAKRALRVEDLRKDNNHYAFVLIALGYWKEQGYEIAQSVLELGLEQSARDEWGFSVLRYLAGQIDELQLLQHAENEDQITEALTYTGVVALLNGNLHKADFYGTKVKEQGTSRVWEYYLARDWLGFDEKSKSPGNTKLNEDTHDDS